MGPQGNHLCQRRQSHCAIETRILAPPASDTGEADLAFWTRFLTSRGGTEGCALRDFFLWEGSSLAAPLPKKNVPPFRAAWERSARERGVTIVRAGSKDIHFNAVRDQPGSYVGEDLFAP